MELIPRLVDMIKSEQVIVSACNIEEDILVCRRNVNICNRMYRVTSTRETHHLPRI